MSTVASLGMLLLWDTDTGLGQIDKYLYHSDNFVKAGAVMAVGILNAGLKSNTDPAFALLQEYIEGTNRDMRLGAIIGFGSYNFFFIRSFFRKD